MESSNLFGLLMMPRDLNPREIPDDLPGSTNRRSGSPLLCPGASRKTKSAGHSARNDSVGRGVGQRWVRKAPPREDGVSYINSKAPIGRLAFPGKGKGAGRMPALQELLGGSQAGSRACTPGTIYRAPTKKGTVSRSERPGGRTPSSACEEHARASPDGRRPEQAPALHRMQSRHGGSKRGGGGPRSG